MFVNQTRMVFTKYVNSLMENVVLFIKHYVLFCELTSEIHRLCSSSGWEGGGGRITCRYSRGLREGGRSGWEGCMGNG